MASNLKTMLLGHCVAKIQQLVTLELNQFLALGAIEMIVLGIPIIMLVDAAPIEDKLSQQSSVNKFSQSSIDRRTTDVPWLTFGWQSIQQLVSIKMVMLLKNAIQYATSLLGIAHAPALEIIAESLLWRQSDLNRFQRIRGIAFRFGRHRARVIETENSKKRKRAGLATPQSQ